MFRLTQFMKELRQPTAIGPRRSLAGPVVIWNLIRRCNLTCRHCYSISADRDFAGELDTAAVFAVLDDLRACGVRAIILSGGEPLLRDDLFEIADRARGLGFYTGLSTNGTLIDDATADRIRDADFGYVGISLDGLAATHDRFRRSVGAFDRSLAALRRCRDRGIKVGVRFTLTQDNESDLPALLDLVDAEGIDRFYLSHLNYAGRGNINRARDAHHAVTRRALDLLFERCRAGLDAGREKEFVTGNNDADGVYFLRWTARHHPDRVQHIRGKLVEWGGNSSGVNIANIDNLGNVHPDTMWWHHTLGNVRERPFSEIWADTSDPLMAGLKSSPRPLKGRCAACIHLDICGGNTRVRAQQLTGDAWAEDPACYLDDAEIGYQSALPRLTSTPYSRRPAGPARVS